MLKGIGAAVALAGALVAGQANATVTFSFVGSGSWTGSHFTFDLPAAPTANGPVSASDCFYQVDARATACSLVLYPDSSPLGIPGLPPTDKNDIVGWIFGPGENDWGNMLFGNGVFGQVGTFASRGGAGEGLLTITDTDRPPVMGAIPEPATWAMMLLGFFGVAAFYVSGTAAGWSG